jgi:hypothetical protein
VPADLSLPTLLLLFAAGVWAGAQNALAGGGSFVTLPALILSGMDAKAANITSAIALFPAQFASGLTGAKEVRGAGGLGFKALALISLAGGACGALLLLATSAASFARLVPWLVLFATALFTWSAFGPKRAEPKLLGKWTTGILIFFVAGYAGYFGGGTGFMTMTVLAFAGQAARTSAVTKNMLAAAMNASAVLIFIFSPEVRWLQAGALALGAVIGGVSGAMLLKRIPERPLKVMVVVIGVALTVGLFWRAA